MTLARFVRRCAVTGALALGMAGCSNDPDTGPSGTGAVTGPVTVSLETPSAPPRIATFSHNVCRRWHA